MDSQLPRSCHARSIASAARRPARAALLLLVLLAGCRSADHPTRDAASLIARAEWERTTPAEGLTWQQCRFADLFGAPQCISVLRVDLRSPLRVRLAASENGREATSSIATRHAALAAVNGSFFLMRGEQAGRSVCFFKIDGRVLAETVGGRGMGAVTIGADGSVSLIRRPKVGWEAATLPASVLAAGPILSWDGIPRPRHEALERHPRTAVGLSPDGQTLVLVTVDGRTESAGGMTLPELRETMNALGCGRSLNLDGGGSSTMWLAGRGVVNHPCDNDRFDRAGERAVANAIMVLPAGSERD